MIDPVAPAGPASLLAADPVAALLQDAQGPGGVLDLGKLAEGLTGAPDLLGGVLDRLSILDATQLVTRLGVLPRSPLNLVTDLAPGPVGDLADGVLEKTTPVADSLYTTHSEQMRNQQFEAQMAGGLWQARADADLQRILSPYLKGPQAAGPSRYAVEVESVIDAIKRQAGPQVPRT